MGGVPCIRGLRIPVSSIVGMVADGMSSSEILKAYPDLEPEHIAQALRYAAYLTKDREIEPPHARGINLLAAPDGEVFADAEGDERVIVSPDTDFGALLALRGSVSPSFVLFRNFWNSFHASRTTSSESADYRFFSPTRPRLHCPS